MTTKRPSETPAFPVTATKAAKTSQEQTPNISEMSPPNTAETTSTTTTTTNGDSSKPRPRRIRKVDGKWVLPLVTKEESGNAKAYLKTHGMVKFLDKYLPDNPRGSDLLFAVVLLGFFQFQFDDDIEDEKNLMKIVRLLQKAMNKVMYMRGRIEGLNTVEKALEEIKKAKKILVLTGAGISTSLGIPDFRSSKGIYSQVQNMGLNDPQEVFDLETFKADPDIFYQVAHMVLPPEDKYTPLHAFIKKLSDEGKLLRNYTQNIDNLEAVVGIPTEKVIQCHGSFAHATCRTCHWKVTGTKIFKVIKKKQIPICPHCSKKREEKSEKGDDVRDFGVLKPDITFFGEDLPKKFYTHLDDDTKECDLLICIGTSLKVAPVSNIVNLVSESVPQILINKDDITHAEFDVSLLGYCDQVAAYLCQRLDWKLNHPDFEKILNSGLTLETIDQSVGMYEVKDAAQLEKERVEGKVEKSMNMATEDISL